MYSFEGLDRLIHLISKSGGHLCNFVEIQQNVTRLSWFGALNYGILQSKIVWLAEPRTPILQDNRQTFHTGDKVVIRSPNSKSRNTYRQGLKLG